MNEIIHREYRIPVEELKNLLGIQGGINTVEFDYGKFDYGKMELVIKMIVTLK